MRFLNELQAGNIALAKKSTHDPHLLIPLAYRRRQARKAVNVLVDLGIMEAKHGSGTIVSSKIKAEELLSQHRDIQSIQEIKQDVFQSIETQKQEFDNMAQKSNG